MSPKILKIFQNKLKSLELMPQFSKCAQKFLRIFPKFGAYAQFSKCANEFWKKLKN
jgi:hypothetical protein